MKYILLALIIPLININNAKAGLYDWEYLEPATGCLIAGGVSYLSSDDESAMKNGAIACGVAGLIVWGIGQHYNGKYGDQFLEEQDYLKSKLNKYNMLESQSDKKKESSSVHFRRVQQILPPSIDKKGQGVGPRVREKLILIDDSMRIGE